MTQQFAAVLLCGGDAERLGYPKEMLRVDGAPLAVKMIDRLKALFAQLSISSNHPAYLRHMVDVPVHKDEFAGAGPLAGMLSGLRHSAAAKVFFLACDMPAVHNGIICRLLEAARHSQADVVVARSQGRVQPLCGVYDRSLVPRLERTLSRGGDLSVQSFLQLVRVEFVDFDGPQGECLRDVDTPQDLWLLRKSFSEVEPLPVRPVQISRLPGGDSAGDLAAEEWPVAVYVNAVKLATVLCLPTALRELAVGFASYLGLLESREQIRACEVDYEAKRASLELDVEEERVRNAVRLLVTSTCGANVYGSELQELPSAELDAGFRLRCSHILECIRSLRDMAPVFARTGCTHQAAFSDSKAIRYLHEDIGRHNAVDKVVGNALMDGADLSRGMLVTTGRLNAEMVIKALRQGVPCLASRSAATAHAIDLAERYGLTLAGFVRGRRINLYSAPERVTDA